jgi:tyrosine-protein phosphatase SIW14
MHVNRRLLSATVLSLALAGSFAPTAVAGPGQSAAIANVDLSSIGIDNFGRVTATYYRGAQPDVDDYADLKALGVRTVIDLQKDGDPLEKGLVQKAGMNFVRIPMTTHEPPTAEKLATFLRLVNDPANQPVFVHCAGGRHRTGVMTAVYRMTNEGWTAEQAFGEMKKYKFGADFLHPEFKRFVYAYHPAPTVTAAKAVAAGQQ